jgi:hypothetical protein
MISFIVTKLLIVISFVMFLFSVIMSADCFINSKYVSWFLYLIGSLLSYISYKNFINSSDEEDYYN